MSKHGFTLQEFIEHLRGQDLAPWQLEVLAALDPENITHEEDPMTYEKRTYPADALDAQPVAQAATPLQLAQGALDDAINELSNQIHQLEDRLQDVLAVDDNEEGSFPQPPPAVPHCCNAVIRIQDQEDRINVLRRKVVDLLNRLEC